MAMACKVLGVVLCVSLSWQQTTGQSSSSILYPRPSESRERISLDAIWDFTPSPVGNSIKGFNDNWFARGLREASAATIPMPVPASYNDITEDKELRDYIGIVWYQRKFFVPASWANKRVWIRFGSVCYAAQVWVNGKLVTSHEIGHLPFQHELTDVVLYGEENVLTVAVDNTLLQTTVPQGSINEMTFGNKTVLTQGYTFDFFNYAGIDRSVFLYTTPDLHLTDLDISSEIAEDYSQATLAYSLEYNGAKNGTDVGCSVSLLNKQGEVVGGNTSCSGTITLNNPTLWWPYLMNPTPGYLYNLKVEIFGDGQKDVYRQPVGIRTISWTNSSVLLNGKPIYIRGFGRHEDSDIRGKGLDLALIVKDHNLIKWIGANAYRTSHYPYAEEIMDMADELGIMIIDECPSVDTEVYSNTLKEKHKTSLTELIKRDKNRPSVIMWSIANEPRTQVPAADLYFGEIVSHVKLLDKSRPVTIAISRTYGEEKAAQHLDVICFNRYNAWYSSPGHTEIITVNVVTEAENWHRRFNKPILMSEYGADTVEGLHRLPEFVWSEEYQEVVMMEHFKAFDILRSRGYFIGELIWNFADFMTAQTTTRVGGNRKGIFTRQRQPKSSAHLMRKRYWGLAHEIDGVPLPPNLFPYTTKLSSNKLNEL